MAPSTDREAALSEWNVRKWTRYGHQRLYAETPGGTALGYLDLKTGRYHSDDLSNLPLLRHAISEHLARQPAVMAANPSPPGCDQPSRPTPSAGIDAPTPLSAPIVHDLSLNRAGAAAREQAIAARHAQGPVKHFFAKLVGARTEERAWRIGADGEEAVAAQLLALGPGWGVLHAVRVGERGSDIDHIVVGPGGVFTINAKNHPTASIWVGGDTFMVNGQRVPYIRNSRHEAKRAARLLTEQAGFPVSVTGIIAVMGAQRGFTVREQPTDGAVAVVTRRQISHHLLAQPERLSLREAMAIFDVARRSTTWCP